TNRPTASGRRPTVLVTATPNSTRKRMATSKRGKRSIYLPLPLPSNNDDQADTQSGWAGGRLGHHCLAGDSTGRTSQLGRENGGFSAPSRRVDTIVSGERALVQSGRVNEQPANA